MNIEEAKEIIDDYMEWGDRSCSCHICPPCRKCIMMPAEEVYNKAKEIINKEER